MTALWPLQAGHVTPHDAQGREGARGQVAQLEAAGQEHPPPQTRSPHRRAGSRAPLAWGSSVPESFLLPTALTHPV